MARTESPLPRRRETIIVQATGDDEFVIKDRATRTYFRVGSVEAYLLSRLDGVSLPHDVCADFELKFREPLSTSDLDDFVSLIKSRNLLQSSSKAAPGEAVPADDEEDELSGQSWLFFRKSVFDPDWLLNQLEPWLRFLWTLPFLLASLAFIGVAGYVLWDARADLVRSFPAAMRWETVAIIWLTLIVVTTIHELAHGLTCKHYGGEVHEIGVLMIFFMPCFYCDVTDAWLIRKKSQRLWVTLAGSYADLCLWACGVFIWRATVPDSLLHYVTQVIMTTCGTRIFLNLNPLLRLDGYYLISDFLEVPNLRVRSREYFMAHVRWLCWGAPRPAPDPRGRTLLFFGTTMWVIAVMALDAIVLGLHHLVSGSLGWMGTFLGFLGLMFVSRRVFKGLLTSEFAAMLKQRHLRTCVWLALVVGGPCALYWIPLDNAATGDVLVRSGRRVEVHAPVAGFLREVAVEEGTDVQTGTAIGRLEVPDLESLIVRKQADLRECEATLTKLRAGPRAEELKEQRARVERAEHWVALAQADFEKAQVSLTHSLSHLTEAVRQTQTELAFAKHSLGRAVNLYKRGAFAGEQLRSEQKRVFLLTSRVKQAEAEKEAREAEGVRSAAAELARREKDLADAQSSLTLLEAGSRPEDVAAEAAKLARLEEELRFLELEEEKQRVVSPDAGVICTPRMSEKAGVLFEKGALICVVEDMSTLRVEIEVDEDSIAGVQPGQNVEMRIRALPFDTFMAKVERIAPSASATSPTKATARVVVLCTVDNSDRKLKAGMTGIARIQRGTRRLGEVLARRALKELRTEFWW